MGTFKEFLQFAKKEKRYWIIPVIIILFILAIFIFFFETAAVAPYVYSLF